jgi:predicted ArsR family transcriptional regulator
MIRIVPTSGNRPGAQGSAGRRPDVLRVLKAAAGPLSIGQIAETLAVHPNTVRFHLDTLIDSGQAERVEPDRSRPGRPAQLFRATRGMDPTGPRHFRILAEILTDRLAAERGSSRRAVEAGQAWGRRLEPPAARDDHPANPVEHLMATLDDLGFAPERLNRSDLGLRNCPFLELAEVRAGIVCPIHLGLMRGALEAWDASVTVDRLDAFVEPDLCVARLGPTRPPAITGPAAPTVGRPVPGP